MPLEYYHNKELLEVGVDEVARGCLFGRVYAAAVIWPQEPPPDTEFYPPIRDSKKLTDQEIIDIYKIIIGNVDFSQQIIFDSEIFLIS